MSRGSGDRGVGSWVAGNAYRRPDRVALIDGDTGEETTWAVLEARTNALARSLAEQGVRRGDRVGLLLLNGPRFVEILVALAKLAAVAVPVNHRLAPPEIRYIAEDSGLRTLLASAPLAGLGTAALEGLGVRTIAVPAAIAPDAPAPEYEALVAAGDPTPLGTDVDLDDLAILMYTSGTTGHPKGAMLTHGTLLWSAVAISTSRLGVTGEDTTLAAAPLFHIGGLGVFVLPLLLVGGTTVTQERFDPAQTLDLLVRHRVTLEFLVPAMWAALAQVPGMADADASALRIALCGGSPTPLPLIEGYRDRGWPFCECFGMTEMSPGVALLDPEDVVRKAGSIGRTLPHVAARAVDEAGRDVRAGEVGELVLRGPNVTAGYWGRPEATREAFFGDWFRTGDLCRIDEEGFITLVDRRKDLVISGGENVYPVEVEQVLIRHPHVAEVAVVGRPDERWGETVVAVVVPDGELDPDALVAWARERLAGFKCPRVVEVVEALPRNATGKVLKRDLRTLVAGTDAVVHR
ncbi:acyl-CoA synthetase [Patulibacter sp. S7RM1-6]